MNSEDRELGMQRAIDRRDFVNGTAVALGAALLPKWSWALALDSQAAQGGADDPYPPRRTGLRGSHAGSFELSHQLRDGRGPDLSRADHTGETYDLVVVGGGLSGLAAAYYFVQNVGRSARVLVLDREERSVAIHLLHVRDRDHVEREKAGVLATEDRVVRAFGSTAEIGALAHGAGARRGRTTP